MNISAINATKKAKNKIQKIASANNLEFDFVYAILSFHWNYDGREGDWVGAVDQDDEYRRRFALIRNCLALDVESLTKAQVVDKIFNQVKTLDHSSLFDNFVWGATQKNYCFISEYASFHYLNNATKDNLDTLDWKCANLSIEVIVKQLFFKIFRGGAIERSSLEYLCVDLTVNLPCVNPREKMLDWTLNCIEKVNQHNPGTFADLLSVVKEYCKADKYFLRSVLEAMSYSGVLKVKGHSISGIFIPDRRRQLAPHFNANEWTYPMRFWN